MIRAILVDDNRTHLNALKKELELYNKDIEVIGAYTTSKAAIPEIMHLEPDVLFLDIEMPGTSGYQLAASVNKICSNVIFLTSHMEYAPESYRHNAIYFINKSSMKEYLPESIAKLKVKLRLPGKIASIIALRSIDLLSNAKIRMLIFDGNEEKNHEFSLKEECYKTLKTFVEVKLGVSKEIQTSYIHFSEHQSRFTNLHKSMTDLVEEVNSKLSQQNIILEKTNLFNKVEKGRYVFALPTDKIKFL